MATDRQLRVAAYAAQQRERVALVASRTWLRELLEQNLDGTIEEVLRQREAADS